jgi:hypothetical protein
MFFTTLASVKYKLSKNHSILFTLQESHARGIDIVWAGGGNSFIQRIYFILSVLLISGFVTINIDGSPANFTHTRIQTKS